MLFNSYSFLVFFPSCSNLLIITPKSKLFMASGSKLLFLYGLECKVCIAIVSVNHNYLSERCIDPVAER